MIKKEEANQIYEKHVSDYIDSRNHAGFHLLKMTQAIAEAKHNLSRKIFKKFLKDPRINVQRLQANKMIAVYHLSKSDSQLTHFINKEGIEKSYLLTVIKDENAREKFTKEIIDIPFTVKQTKQAIQKIANENKTPVQAIREVQNKIRLTKPKERSKTVSLEDYEKLKKENEILLQKIAELEQKKQENPFQKTTKVQEQQPLAYDYLN